MAVFLELLLQAEVVLHDAVVHYHHVPVAVSVRVRVYLVGAAVRGPARVSNAHYSQGKAAVQRFDKRTQLSRGLVHGNKPLSIHNGDARTVISAVLQTLQSL